MKEFGSESLGDGNAIIFGASGTGKSSLLQLITHSLVKNPLEGISAIDPHGEYVQGVGERIANPKNGLSRNRTVHLLKPGSDLTFGCNPLETYDDTPEAAHDAANLLLSVIEARFGAPAEETPRLAKIIYIAASVAARKGLTVVEMMQLLSLGRAHLREALLENFDNSLVRNEFEDLKVLAARQPARFLEYVESAHSRFVRALGDRRITRILDMKKGLNPRKIMDGREIVLLDLSALNEADKAFVGTLVTSTYVAAAMRRTPSHCARHRLILDEAEALLTVDTARLVDRTRKYGLNLICAVQRLGQLRAKGDFVLDALMTNCLFKVSFGGLQYDDARYMALNLFAGHLDLREWKEGSERPAAVGQDLRAVKQQSKSHHDAEHESSATTRSGSRSHARGVTTATGTVSMEGWAQGEQVATAISTGPENLYWNPFQLGGFFNMGDTAAQTRGTNSIQSGGTSTIETTAVSEMDVESEGWGESQQRGTSRGRSSTKGESEVFVTKYNWMPSSMYTLEEQIFRVTAQLMNLPKRECIVKIAGASPLRTRTADLEPAFRSGSFKKAMVPVFKRACALRSPYMIPVAEADRLIEERMAALQRPNTNDDGDFIELSPTEGRKK